MQFFTKHPSYLHVFSRFKVNDLGIGPEGQIRPFDVLDIVPGPAVELVPKKLLHLVDKLGGVLLQRWPRSEVSQKNFAWNIQDV